MGTERKEVRRKEGGKKGRGGRNKRGEWEKEVTALETENDKEICNRLFWGLLL